MAIPLVLTSLADKRARLEAERQYHQKRADKAAEDIAKIDAVIALWDEKPQLVAARRRYPEHAGEFQWKEVPRMVIAILRDIPDGLTTAEVQHIIAERRDITEVDELRRLARRVTAALNDKRRCAVLVKDGMRDRMHVYRIAVDGEGVRCPHRIAHAKAASARRTAERLARRKR